MSKRSMTLSMLLAAFCMIFILMPVHAQEGISGSLSVTITISSDADVTLPEGLDFSTVVSPEEPSPAEASQGEQAGVSGGLTASPLQLLQHRK